MLSNTFNSDVEKVALDDFLDRHGKDALTAFMDLPYEDYAESAELWRLNTEIAAVNNPNAIWEFAARRFLKSKQDLTLRFGDRIYKVKTADGEGLKEVSAIEQWVEWPGKGRYKSIVYAPGERQIVDDCINTWPGWGCKPVKGDVAPFHELVAFVFKDSPELIPHFMQWLAYPLQKPGEKSYTAYLLLSAHHGVGKSLVGYTVGEIYGEDNFVAIDHEVMKGGFNSWAAHKQFILGEEIAGGNARTFGDRFKHMVSCERIYVNKKYEPEYVVKDCNNYLLTSNHARALLLEAPDRRVAVVETNGPAMPENFYNRVGLWRDKGGPSHLFHYLLHDVDLSDYNPKAHAPTSVAKREMIEASKTALECFADDVVNDPDSVLKAQGLADGQELFTAELLCQFATQYCERKITKSGVGGALKKVGITRKAVKLTGERVVHLYPVRNTAGWLNKKPSEWRDHYARFERKKKF